jgi:PmbA protein
MNTIETMIAHAQDALTAATSMGAVASKIGLNCGETMSVNFEAGRLKDTGSAQILNFNVDALVKGRRGSAACGHPDELTRAVERAVGLAKLGSIAHFTAWPAAAPTTPVSTFAESTVALTREYLIAACQTIAEAMKAYDPNLFISCSANRSVGESLLLTSGGVLHRQRGTRWDLSCCIQRTNGTDMLFAADGRGWGERNNFFDPPAIAERILFQLRHAEQTIPAPTGKVKAFLMPETLAAFLWPIGMGINGRRVAKGESPLSGKLGQRVLSPTLTIVDDPHRPYCPAAAEIDSDGIPTRRQVLVQDGVLQRFLYDLDSAGLAGAEPTGNSGCAPYHAVVSPGRRPSAELLASLDDGLYLTNNLIGFGQSNIINGDFSCNVGLGYRIKNGEIVGRVKDTMIAGNLYDILGGNVELSSDTSYDGTYPYAVVEGITASTKA